MIKNFLAMLVFIWCVHFVDAQQFTKYSFVTAHCKAAFPAMIHEKNKAILTTISRVTIDNEAGILSAEKDVKSKFEAALLKQYPGGLNQIDQVKIYIYNSPEEAGKQLEEIKKSIQDQGSKVIELPLPSMAL